MRIIVLFLLAAVTLRGVPVFAQAAMDRNALDRLKRATVFVRTEAEADEQAGSGFLIGKIGDVGYLATNSHVVELENDESSRSHIAVLYSGTRDEVELPAEVVVSDRERDIAILRVESPNLPPPIRVVPPEQLAETMPVIIAGFPFAGELAVDGGSPAATLSQGTIAGIRRSAHGELLAIQIDGSLNPGTSGGPIVRRDGQLVAIASAKVSDTQIGFGIPVNHLYQLLMGRVADVRFVRKQVTPRAATFEATAQVLDPLNKLKSVYLNFIPQSDVPSLSDFHVHEQWQPLSRNLRRFETGIEDQQLKGTVVLRRDSGKDVPYYVQPSYVYLDGKTTYGRPEAVVIGPGVATEDIANAEASTPTTVVATPLASDATLGPAFFPLAAPGGFAMFPDGITLVVSQPKTGELVYFDTMSNQERNRVNVDFKPAAIARQNKTLYVAGEGSSRIHAVDAESGRVRKQMSIGADAIAHIACHPSRGMIYATTLNSDVYAIEPSRGTARKTKAVGDFVAVDPISGSLVYTGIKPPPGTRDLIITYDSRGNFSIVVDRWGIRGAIIKYRVASGGLNYMDHQSNSSVNPNMMYLSPDGKRIMMPGGGGWRPLPGAGGFQGGYVTAVFATNKLEEMVGQAPQAANIAMHPVLNLGVSNIVGRELVVFNSNSYVERQRIQVAQRADMRPYLLTFGGKGTKAIVWNGDNPANPEEGLHFLPLELTDDEFDRLEENYGRLPPRPGSLAAATPHGRPDEASNETPPTSTPASSADLPPNTIAFSGFNDTQGMGRDSTADIPFAIGKENRPGGQGESGWRAPWPASPHAMVQKHVVYEGDGALKLHGTVNYGRGFAQPQSGTIRVEQYVQIPAGGDLKCYVWQQPGAAHTGPMWQVVNGTFQVLAGDEAGGGKWFDVGPATLDQWHQVAVTIDMAARQWEFVLDGQPFSEAPLGFRGRPQYMHELNYLVETTPGAFVDAIMISSQPSPQ